VASGAVEFLGNFLGYLGPFLFVLALVVFVHEMGHFLVGRLCGVKVEVFSLGFGPRLLSMRDRKGTEWALSAIPLGGYVRFKGDADAASTPDHAALAGMSEADKSDSFPHKSLLQRSAIVAAGPLANFLLAFVIFAATFMLVGRMAIAPIVGNVSPGSAAERAGFVAGDKVISVSGQPVATFDEIVRRVSVAEGELLHFSLERDGRILEVSGTPTIISRKTMLGTDRRPVMGFAASTNPAHLFTRYYGPLEAARTAIGEIAFVIERTGHYISGVIIGREKVDQLSGPTRIAYISGKVAESGIGPLLMLAGILSISIGLINLLPVPMLDGGHLLFYALEAIFGRPLSPRTQEISFRVGFALVIMLMLFSTWNDIIHLTGLAF